jgi:hypothetical protein
VVLACAACSSVAQQQRRVVRVRQRVLAAPQEEEHPQQQQQVAEARSAQVQQPEVQYYHVVPESEEYQAPQRAAAPVRQQQYLPRADTQRAIQSGPRTRDPLATRAPPVQTIRNFNTINDDGSFTFGYEAADGSFKEETRGVDCVVRGKYGYVDPEGNKREFTYVSGNPCDPNNPDPEEDDRSIEEEDSEENIPARRPVVRPNVSRARPANVAPTTAVFQNAYQGQRLSQNSIEQHAAPVAVTPRPVARPTVAVTARPVTRQQTVYATPPAATTYRPQIQNYPTVTSTAAPAVTRNLIPAYAVTPSSGAFDFDAELQKFDLKSASPTPASRPQTTSFQASPYNPTAQPSAFKTAAPAATRPAGNPYYNSQLIFDPATGQYNTVLYQQLPKGLGDFSHNTRLQPYVHNPQQYQQQQQQPLYQPQQLSQPSPFAPSHLQGLRAGPSEQLRTAPARYPANVIGAPQGQQSFYYVNPSLRNQFSTGQIDSFLKGHNLQI